MKAGLWSLINGTRWQLARSVQRWDRNGNNRLSNSEEHASLVTRINGIRTISTTQKAANEQDTQPSERPLTPRRITKDKLAQRDFFLDVLNVSATRRDAKQYLARFKSPNEQKTRRSPSTYKDPQRNSKGLDCDQERLDRTGVNLGCLYTPTRAIADSPIFQQHESQHDQLLQKDDKVVHVALVNLRAPQTMTEDELDGISHTLAQLVRLDMQIVLTFDCSKLFSDELLKFPHQQICQEQADRIVRSLEKYNNAGARYVDSAFTLWAAPGRLNGPVELAIPKLIIEPLRRTTIPVIPTLAYNETFRKVPVRMADVMLALTRSLSEVDAQPPPPTRLGTTTNIPSVATALDRIILVDPLGGLPSLIREDGSHVFVNLEQEYQDIEDELSRSTSFAAADAKQHLHNIETLRNCLALLPPATSALIISPQEAATSAKPAASDTESVGISTRRSKNPLIHNLLTNKPVISSSLPVARLSTPASTHSISTSPSRSTLVKRGMPLTMIPDPRVEAWMPPANGESTITLEDHPEINFPRLLGLIEDSFRRPLDVQHYLRRIRNRIAGIIIAGEYEGGAILTWEMPPTSSLSQGSEDVARLVPYLDKFAVLQRSQGSSGVADIVFQAMVRSCFPTGVCWRSRQDNPVNKWYFERSRGSWKLPGGQWTMFWTTEGLESDKTRFEEYAAVCAAVTPSWRDGKKPD